MRRLLSIPVDEFAERHWAQQPLYCAAPSLPRSFSDLFSTEAADELLSTRGLRTPFIRVAKDGAIVDASRYTRSGGVGALVGDQVVDDRILDLFADGHTVVLQGLHRMWPELIAFGGDLSDELGHPTQINAYVTPSASQGFSAHYDIHDVFVLQIAGSKRWIVHEPVYADPLRTEPWTNRRAAVEARAGEDPTLDVELQPGDMLYLPRGYIHAAEALGDTSIHLTVGIQSHTRHAVVEALAELVGDDDALRQSLPFGIDVRDADQIAAEVAATIEALKARLDTIVAGDVARVLEQRTRSATRPAPLEPLALARALASLAADTVVSARRHLRTLIVVRGDRLAVDLPGRSVSVPLVAREALDALITDGVSMRIGDMPGIDPAEALAVARDLVRAGVLVPQQPPKAPG